MTYVNKVYSLLLRNLILLTIFIPHIQAVAQDLSTPNKLFNSPTVVEQHEKEIHQENSYAQVISVQGASDFNQKSLFLKEMLAKEGTVETKKGSRIKLYFYHLRAVVILNENSSLEITFGEDKVPHFFQVKGKIRFVVEDINKSKKSPFVLHTEKSMITSHGGDFVVTVFQTLSEIELLTLGGKAFLESKINTADKREVAAKEWVGLGGRFGLQVANKITFPETLFEQEKDMSTLSSRLGDYKDPLLYNQIIPSGLVK